MLEKNEVPVIVNDLLKPYVYKKGKKSSQLFPLKINHNNKYYYCFTVTPNIEYVVIMENGTTPYFDEAKGVVFLAVGFHTTNNNLNNIGKGWLNPSTKIQYENLLKTLEKLQEKIKTLAPTNVLQPLQSYMEMAEYSIKQQEEIKRTVKEGLEYAESVNDGEVLVESDVTFLHQNKNETMRALNQKQLNQMETTDDRKKVLSFLFKKMWIKPVLFFYLLSLIRYQMKLRSNRGSEAKEQRKLKKRLDTGSLSEEQVESDKDILNSILNPEN